MEQGICQFRSFPKEIKHSSENKVNFFFLMKFLHSYHTQFNICSFLYKFSSKIILFQEALQVRKKYYTMLQQVEYCEDDYKSTISIDMTHTSYYC